MPKRRQGSVLTAPQAPAGAAKRKAARKPAVAEPPILAGLDAELGDSLTSAKMATERRRARLMEIEVQIRRGDLILRADADREHFRAARLLRDRILGLAPRIAAEAHAAQTLAACQRILERELRLALTAIAEEIDRG
jgi:hypothetical protein